MSRVRNLVDFTTLTHDFDGDGTLDFSVTGTLTGGAVSSPNVPEVDLNIAPEILEIQVNLQYHPCLQSHRNNRCL